MARGTSTMWQHPAVGAGRGLLCLASLVCKWYAQQGLIFDLWRSRMRWRVRGHRLDIVEVQVCRPVRRPCRPLLSRHRRRHRQLSLYSTSVATWTWHIAGWILATRSLLSSSIAVETRSTSTGIASHQTVRCHVTVNLIVAVISLIIYK